MQECNGDLTGNLDYEAVRYYMIRIKVGHMLNLLSSNIYYISLYIILHKEQAICDFHMLYFIRIKINSIVAFALIFCCCPYYQQAHPLFLNKKIHSGEVQLRRPLKETDPQDFRLYIIASDQGSPRKSTVCQVPIRIVLGSSAVQLVEPFDRYLFIRIKNIKICYVWSSGSAVFTVNATVSDPSASISYKLKESNSQFSIDQYSGEIILTDELDVYNTFFLLNLSVNFKSSQYLLSVQAATGSSTSNMLIIIDITDVNNNYPVIQNSSDILVWPDSPKIIHYVIASDKDSGENAELSFQIIPEHNDFNINKKTGALSMLRNPLLDQSILIRVSDQGSPPLYTDQILNIRISNDTKRWKYFDRTEYTIKITSEVKKGATIVDIGGSGATRLKLFPETKIFKLDQKSGIITVDGNVKDKSYTLTVMAQSSTGEVDWAVVSVEVAPPETIEGPTISSASCGSITVPENRSIKGMKNIVVTGNGSGVLFRLQSSTSLFEIEPSTGQISCSPLDREMKSEHLLVVIADENGKTDSCTIRVTVADENDNSPQFASSTPQVIFLNSTTSVGTVVHRFVATDPDLNSNGKLIEDSSKMFDIITETGDLILASAVWFLVQYPAKQPTFILVDYFCAKVGVKSYSNVKNLPTTQKEWMIRVRAYDQGIGTLKIDRYIRIKNDKINLQKYDSQPSFLYQEYISSIDEGLDRGQVITKGNTDGAFEVDSDGVVRTSQELDYEKQSEYILKIIGTGDFPEQISTRVIIRVNNLNDNPPFIPLPKKRKVPESNDMDKNRILEYTLESGEDKFVIDRFTGVIHSKTNLDYETTKEMTAIVKVTDGNFSNTTSLQVSIMDVNDNAPKFSQHFYEIKIPLSTHPDDVIIKLMNKIHRKIKFSITISYYNNINFLRSKFSIIKRN
uniref:Cadherin domain-containing protein n=1 Tax=Heterorhabditis bacteriophora TaxID=37862 RepID=A0A1I7WF94_HETBA